MIIDVGDTCSFGDIVLGQTDDAGVESYFLALDGWESSKSTVQATQRAAGDGGFPSPAYATSKHITVEGALVATSRAGLEVAFDRVQAAASLNIGRLTVNRGGAVRYVLAQREGEIGVTADAEIYRAFSIQFLATDQRRFGGDIVVSTGLPSGTGGWTFPFTFPLTIASTIVSGVCAATSPGSALGKVTARIDGPITGPVITHTNAAGQSRILAFSPSYQLVAGNWLDIDMDAETALENGQAERIGYATVLGFSSFEPGLNQWALSAASGGPAARLTITASPAWP